MNDKITFVKEYMYYNFKNLFNPVYSPEQNIHDTMQNGSRKRFGTDGSINGEYFRSMSDNQYFAVMDKSVKKEDIDYFMPSNNLPKVIDFKNKKIYRLEIVRNKGYFIESNQYVFVKNPDITEIDIPIDELIIPSFKPLPQDISFNSFVWYLRK